MSKRNRQKRKLRKLIQERMREIQTQPANANQETQIKNQKSEAETQSTIETPKSETEKITKKQKIETEQKSEQDVANIHPDFKKIGIISAILAIIFIGIYFINIKTPLLNNLANKLYTIFENS